MNSGSFRTRASGLCGHSKSVQDGCRPQPCLHGYGGRRTGGRVRLGEGVMASLQYKLDNLCAVVDRNRLQISGSTEDVMHHDDLAARFAAFGWNVLSVPAMILTPLLEAFEQQRKTKGCPTVVIANTTKGCGVSFMENRAEWHACAG